MKEVENFETFLEQAGFSSEKLVGEFINEIDQNFEQKKYNWVLKQAR